jgi:DNA primase
MIRCPCSGIPYSRFSQGSGPCDSKKLPPPTILAWQYRCSSPTLNPGGENSAMVKDLEWLKQRIPLLEFLQRHNWRPCRAGRRQEFVGLCPLHQETRPSFYVNAGKNLFYCHGCGRGGDLIRFAQLFFGLPFHQTVAHLKQELMIAPAFQLLEPTAAFYQLQLHRHPEATRYLEHRGLHDPAVIEELGIGYAPGGNLRRHLAALGYSFDLLLEMGLIKQPGRDAFCRRVIFPCRQHGRIVNLYGRSIGAAFPHRLLPRSKGGLFAWESVSQFSTVILVEGLFDLAVLWQAGFHNTTCAIGTQLTPVQLAQLSDQPERSVYIVFDQDDNQAGQKSSHQLALRLKSAGIRARIVQLPHRSDPNSYFVAGASAADFTACLQETHEL